MICNGRDFSFKVEVEAVSAWDFLLFTISTFLSRLFLNRHLCKTGNVAPLQSLFLKFPSKENVITLETGDCRMEDTSWSLFCILFFLTLTFLLLQFLSILDFFFHFLLIKIENHFILKIFDSNK